MRHRLLAPLLLAACVGDDRTTDTAASSSTSTTAPEPTSAPEPTGDPTGGTFLPTEGTWTFTIGAEVARTCKGGQSGITSHDEYRLANSADDTFTLTYPGSEDPIHTCTRDGASFECPMVMIGGTTCESWDATFNGEFESATHASGEWLWRFNMNIDLPFCPDFGDVNPCTITHTFTAVRTAD